MKYLIIIIIIISQNIIVLGQTTSLEENLKIGVEYFYNASYSSSLELFERFINKIPTPKEYDETYASVLYMCSFSALEIKDYEKSLSYNKKALSWHNSPIEYQTSLLNIQLQVYERLLDYDNCRSILTQLEELYNKYDSDHTIKINILAKVIRYYTENKCYDIIKTYENILPRKIIPENVNDIDKKILLINWNTVYNAFAITFSEINNHEKALEYFLKAVEVLIPDIEKNRQSLYFNIAREYYKLNNIDKALEYQIKAIELLDDNNKDKSYVAKNHLQLGVLYDSKYMYKEALAQIEKADYLYSLIKDTENHAYTQTMLYHLYFVLGEKEKCKNVKTYLKTNILEDTIKDTEIAIIVNSNLGDFYSEDGEYEKALDIYYKYLEKAKVFYGDKSQKLFSHYYKTISLLLTIGDYNSAEQMIDCAKLLFLNTGYESNDYCSLILLESSLNIKQGNLGKAVSSLEELSLQIKSTSILQYELYSALGNVYSEMGEFERALKYTEMALHFTEKTYGKKTEYYAIELINLSELHALLENKVTALELTQSACDLFEDLYGKNSKQYYNGLEKLAMRYHDINDKKAYELKNECLELSKSLFGEESNEFAESLFYSVALSINATEEDINKIRQAIDIKRKIGQTNDITYLHFLSIYSTYLFVDHDWVSLYIVCNEILDVCKTYITSNFRYFTEQNRETIWQRINESLSHLENYAAQYSSYAVENKDFRLINEYGVLAYDTQLLTKGFLLSSSKRLDELFQISDDSIKNTLLQNITQLRTKQKLLENEFIKNEKIEQKIHEYERDIIKLVSKNGDYLDFTSIKWQEIQKSLLPGEVAIEFFSYIVQNEIQYGAVWLTQTSNPIALNLFCEFELNNYKRKDNTIYNYTDPGMYKTIWSVLETFSDIKNARTIYFSADNLLNSIAIENLCDLTGKLASEKRQIFRLTSTRELVRRNKIIKRNSNAVLYGGLNYNSTISQILLANKQLTKSNQKITKRYKKGRSLRDKADYLGWTLAEVNNIAKLMKKYNPEVLSGHEGTEESFMALFLKSPSILHIATHGFYYDTNEIYNKMRTTPEKYQFLDSKSIIKPTVECLAMKGSGLLLSGANTLSRQRGEENIEDGILTAEEISHINLRSVDLAVLSACETGLGEVSEEGVFGLQRGFKLAGVNSLLMSLWKVDDEATAILMTSFYQNLLKGMNKIESLQKAQQYVKSQRGWEDPKYWAGFIFLDAIN